MQARKLLGSLPHRLRLCQEFGAPWHFRRILTGFALLSEPGIQLPAVDRATAAPFYSAQYGNDRRDKSLRGTLCKAAGMQPVNWFWLRYR